MAKILVVDDHATNRQLIVTLVGYKGHQACEAADGAEALAVAGRERPDLIICDVLMPTMDGYEFVRQMRADPSIASTEVIFYTANYHEQDARNLAKACGVSRVLIKPSEPDEILQIIDQALTQSGEPEAQPVGEEFDREHMRLMTDKLSEKADKLQYANQRFSALTTLNMQLASEQNPRTLLDKVCLGARDLIGARYAVLCVREKSQDEKRYCTFGGIDAQTVAGLAPPDLDGGALGRVVRERESCRLKNPTGNARAVGLPADYPDLHSALVCPIASLSTTYGWICLADKLGAEEFSSEDEHLLTIFGAQVGRIYENGSLFEQVQRHAAQLEREIAERKQAEISIRRLNRVYAVLSGINTLIVRVRDPEELFQESCRIAFEEGQFGLVGIGLIDPESYTLKIVSQRGFGTTLPPQTTFSLVDSGDDSWDLVLQALEDKKPIFNNDIAAEQRSNPIRRFAVAQGYRSVVMLPLMVESSSVGIMALYSREAGYFDDAEMKLLDELANDISFALDHLAKSARLDYLAYHDALTGLTNPVLFRERLEQHLTMAAMDEHKLALIMIDLDRFRAVNDSLGRQAGDELLREVAERLIDYVHDARYITRISADLFAVVLPEIQHEADVARRVKELQRACFSEPFRVHATPLRASAKFGAAIYPNDGSDAETVFRNTEAALKKAKASGEQLVFYTEEMTERVAERLSMETKLREALERDEFLLHYQPKVDIERRGTQGVEALLRWNSPNMGLVLPNRFIPLLEETGLILDVGAWALRRAVLDHRHWVREKIAAPRIAVNVSAIQLRQQNFVDVVREAIQEGANPPGIDIEITESLLMEDLAGNIKKLKVLRELGLEIAIDDFGTGYSSLGYLAKLPVHTLKIDRSFITSMVDDADTLAVVSTIISLAHSLHLKVVAEGVETEEQAKMLRLLHCDQIQGFLISRPIPIEDMTQYLGQELS